MTASVCAIVWNRCIFALAPSEESCSEVTLPRGPAGHMPPFMEAISATESTSCWSGVAGRGQLLRKTHRSWAAVSKALTSWDLTQRRALEHGDPVQERHRGALRHQHQGMGNELGQCGASTGTPWR
ncbi:unnamed protein product [Prorocentrum cordatum]|uniref:Uncharacterized protein n=1 Tax=Prorocentrum cordatum TaxID=2364126 RepID=A0ABN9X1C9_9DINO|nr:unnamed protein product [Polarella glacialis]